MDLTVTRLRIKQKIVDGWIENGISDWLFQSPTFSFWPSFQYEMLYVTQLYVFLSDEIANSGSLMLTSIVALLGKSETVGEPMVADGEGEQVV